MIYNDAKHWRERSAEARAVADQLSDIVARSEMLQIAEKYDGLAKRAEERIAAK